MRLSASSFAGTARTLVAVGSSSEACIFFAIAPAAPRSGLTVTSSASSPWDFAGVVDPAAGLDSPVSAAGRVLAEPLADPDDAAFAGALPLVLPLPFVVDDAAPALPLVDRVEVEVPPDEVPVDVDPPEAEPDDEAAPDEDEPDEDEPVADAPPADDVADPAVAEAPVEDAELAPAVFSPSAGA
jgi:hypothetical protein